MLTSFAIDPRGIHPEAGLGGSRAAHERLLRLWARLGILVCTDGAPDVHAAVKALPQELRKLWMTALKSPRVRVDHRLGSLGSASELAEIMSLSGATQVVFCGDALAACCGLVSTEQVELDPSGFEAVRIAAADASARFRASEELANRPVDEGANPAKTWTDRFEPLARCARTVVVIDRFAASRRLNDSCGIARLLRGLAATGRVHELIFYSETPEIGADAFFAFVDGQLTALGAGAPRTTVRLAPPDAFGPIAHGRSLRFDRLICEVDLGLEVIEGAACYRLSSFSMKPLTDEHRRLEERLRAVARRERKWGQ